MNLSKKKELAAKSLGVGKNRVCFSEKGISEIKEAITKQDIKSLYQEGIITVKPVKGRKKVLRRKTRRGPGKIKKKVNKRKQEYIRITRKLRAYISDLREKNKIGRELYSDLRKKIRTRSFKSKANLRDYLENLEKLGVKEIKIKTTKVNKRGKKNKK
jgi:large subunit ribosomal protein L19e